MTINTYCQSDQVDASTQKKPPLLTTVEGWIVSNQSDFIQPLSDYLALWPNTSFHPMGEFELRSGLNNLKQTGQPDVIFIDGECDWNVAMTLIQDAMKPLCPIILVTGNSDTNLLRQALRKGVKDVLTIPFDEQELDQILFECAESKKANQKQGQVSIFMNAKGGMGSSVLSTTVAHLLTLEKYSTVLIDTDAQFGCVSELLSTPPKFLLNDALKQVKTMDEYALNGVLTKHASGLRFITSRSDALFNSVPEFSANAFHHFLEQSRSTHSHIIIDMSRGLENWSSPALTMADHVFIVVQQSIPAIREAAVLIKQLRHLFGYQHQQIKVIVNRYSKSINIKPEEIKATLHTDQLLLVPNDYTTVSASSNLGELLATHFEKTQLVKALRDVTHIIAGQSVEESKGLRRFFTFLRS